MAKDVRLGPRSAIFMWAVLLPVMLTFLVQVAFASLFEPVPRLGIVDQGDSEVAAQARRLEGIRVTMLDDPEELMRQVEANDQDAGIVLQAGFDEAVRAGERPELRFHISGESLASNRGILSVTALDLVREVEGRAAPVEVEIVDLGEESLPIATRLVPVIVMYALIMAGVFLTAFAVVEERERGTLDALLVTPVRLSEVLAAKAAVGFAVAVVMSVVTLALNDALGASPGALLLGIGIAAAVSALIGLVFATASKDTQTLFGLVKGTGFLIFGPVIFYIFPDWPQWIARLFPTFWVIDPIYRIAIQGAGLADVWAEMAAAVGIGLVLLGVVRLLARRMQERLAVS
ncbi:MAG: ABC transporter permease [Coriobacteriia bacterium]|nr:ABC transporter permease [Coriobacteriia bacterium]